MPSGPYAILYISPKLKTKHSIAFTTKERVDTDKIFQLFLNNIGKSTVFEIKKNKKSTFFLLYEAINSCCKKRVDVIEYFACEEIIRNIPQ